MRFYLTNIAVPERRYNFGLTLLIGEKIPNWNFSLVLYPHWEINNWKDWKKFLKLGEIHDENDKEVLYENFVTIVEQEENKYPLPALSRNDVEIYNNLYRYKISPWCFGHGEGAYSYFLYLFDNV